MLRLRPHLAGTVAVCTLLMLATASSAGACPRPTKRATPTIAVYSSLQAAQKGLQLHPSEKLADHAKQSSAFEVSSYIPGRSEGDRGSYMPNAVFIVGKKVVAARKLALNTTARPGAACMHVKQHRITELRVVGDKGRIGHFRVLREDVTDAATLAARTSGSCSARIKYRIEDHFIDLARGRYLAVYDQVFEDTIDNATSSLPGVAFDAFTVGSGATITPGTCAE